MAPQTPQTVLITGSTTDQPGKTSDGQTFDSTEAFLPGIVDANGVQAPVR